MLRARFTDKNMTDNPGGLSDVTDYPPPIDELRFQYSGTDRFAALKITMSLSGICQIVGLIEM